MLVVNDALDALYLGTFLFGLLFSGLSLLIGAGHVGGHLHFHGHGSPHAGNHSGDRAGLDHGRTARDGIGPLSLSSVLAFAAWFGGVGYHSKRGRRAGAP